MGVVSKRQSALGKQRYKYVEAWTDSVQAARKSLHISGFVALNGQTLTGKALYVTTKALYASKSSALVASSRKALGAWEARRVGWQIHLPDRPSFCHSLLFSTIADGQGFWRVCGVTHLQRFVQDVIAAVCAGCEQRRSHQ